MYKHHFPGEPSRMIPPELLPIARAMKDDRVTALAAALRRVFEEGALEGSAFFGPPRPDRYRRKLVWRDPDDGFVIVGMTWAPGQSSPLHDHAGLWGGEIVASGAFEEVTFALMERDTEGRCRFRELETRIAGAGSVSILNPPFEYHALRNAGDVPAHTLHVYSGELARSHAFVPANGDWYLARTTELRYDA